VHLVKEYIAIYNHIKELIKKQLIDIENILDEILFLKDVKDIKELNEFNNGVFKKGYETIIFKVEIVADELNKLQQFCYEDIKNVIPFVPAVSKLPEHDAFQQAKNIDWLIETIQKDSELDEKERKRLLEISQFNKRIRYFIHSTLAFVENPLPFGTHRRITKTLKEKSIPPDWEKFINEDISYHLAEVYRLRKAVDQFHILSDADYGDWASYDEKLSDFIAYLNLYKQRFQVFYYNNEYFNINVSIENRIKKEMALYLPMVKAKEVIDVLMHNAAEELVEKDKIKNFEKHIDCIVEYKDERIKLSIMDNGRGIIEGTNVNTAFLTTKNNSKNIGIGLDIANKIAKIFKGSLESFNNKNKNGACFVFTFPIRILVRQEGFRRKLNVLVLNNSKEVESKLEEYISKYDDVRTIKADSRSLVDEFAADEVISCIDVVLTKKGNDLLTSILNNSKFKGNIEYV